MKRLASPTSRPQGPLLAWTNRITDEASDTVIRSIRVRAGGQALLKRRSELVAERRTLLKERHALLRWARSAPSGHRAVGAGKLSPEPLARLVPL